VRGGWFVKDGRDCAAFRGSLSIERRRAFEDHFMRWLVTLCLLSIAAVPISRPASAAEDALEKLFIDTCLVNEAGWIGRDQKSVAANCACKAKTELKLADPAFKQAVAKQQPYDKFPFGDPADYQRQVLQDCPAIRPLMVQAMCNDPAAPPDACTAVKDMVSKLK
jgi:hypothetical protein